MPVAQTVKNLPSVQETRAQSLHREDPPEKGMVTTPVFWPGEFVDRGAWWASVCGVAESGTELSDCHTRTLPLSHGQPLGTQMYLI